MRQGASALAEQVDAAPAGDPLVARIRERLPALDSAVAAAETGGDRAALRVVKRSLKAILGEVEKARRARALGDTGARLLDIARETRRQLRRLARKGGA